MVPIITSIIIHFIFHICWIIIIIIFLFLLLAKYLLTKHIDKQVPIIIIIVIIFYYHRYLRHQGSTHFSERKKKKHVKIQGATRVTCCKFHTEDPQIFGATVQNIFALGEQAPGICAPLIIVIRPGGL